MSCSGLLKKLYLSGMDTKKKVESAQGSKPQVTVEMVKEWVRRDIASGSYFLSMLMKHPDVVDKIAEELFNRVEEESTGSAIDHIEKRKEAANAD